MPKKYVVELSSDEREQLLSLVRKGKALARKRQHAQILLKADQAKGAPAWTDTLIAQALDVSVLTVERVRKRLVLHGLEDAIERRQDPYGPIKRKRLDGDGEARLCKLACSPAPDGRECWTMQLLADKLVELKIIDRISDETVRNTLKKMNSNPG
jgi:hypothetical protein